MFMEPQETDEEVVKTDDGEAKKLEVSSVSPKDNHGMGQHFFPSFAPVFSLGHSRPPQLFHQENYFSKSRASPSLGPDYNPFRAYRESSYKVPITIDDDPISSNILGSGNFGVLKGGTYYNDEDRGEFGLFNPYYSNNGHGRPYSANPRPQKYSNGDFFANFRDFADINTPNKASFSEYVIVYVNKNASKTDEGTQVLPPGKITRPKNIIEQLSMLDNTESETPAPEKKVSLHKRKLALLHQEKTNKEKKSYFKKKEPLEPLLALS
ncbi:UNVERIFIED_CONTAM: hypothetical protein PYX00_007027 [Menopon gallinae]|uniref:Uncharacterized protein n=1 Tax=Menopon gallinae TaxID=328185 RepID=A0AAW2HHF7_9NEOP